jgi:cysteine-rich repeat protein
MARNLASCVRSLGWGVVVAALPACPNLGYVNTDPADPDYPDPDSEPVTSATYPTTTQATTTSADDTTAATTTFVTLTDPTFTSAATTTSVPDTTTTDPGPTTTPSSGSESADTDQFCGDGVVEGTEACDDGNDVSGDGCEPNCTETPVCGNGVLEAGETCDDGNNVDGDQCSADCLVMAVCGNGEVEGDEQCDDGNDLPDDGCQPDCTTLCGNGALDPGEACDDGNVIDVGPGDACTSQCVNSETVCAAPSEYLPCDAGLDPADKSDPNLALRAIGVCNDQPDNSVATVGLDLTAVDGASWQVARSLGTFTYDHDGDVATADRPFFAAREGESLLVLSTGTIAAPDAALAIVEAPNSQLTNDDNANSDDDTLPFPFTALPGSNGGAGGTPFHACDAVHDCSDSLDADWQALPDPHDTVALTFDAVVPPGTFGWTMDIAICSSEWPGQLQDPARDLFTVWQSDGSLPDIHQVPQGPFTGNAAYLADPQDPAAARPLTVTTLHPHFLGPGFVFNEPQLAGTGFEQHACSAWLTVRGGVRPEAVVTIGVLLADRGDDARATVALVDNFRWDCVGCRPDVPGECATTVACCQ